MLDNHWQKSRYSGTQDCVEVRHTPEGRVEMRDSKAPEMGTLKFSESEFNAFLNGIKAGDFDLPEDEAASN